MSDSREGSVQVDSRHKTARSNARCASANGMVRPCSCPASKRSWQGAPQTRSTPCLRHRFGTGEKPTFPSSQYLCHNAKVVHAFEANTPFEKLPGTQITYRSKISIAPAAPSVPHFPRLRAWAFCGRRPPQLVDSVVIPASKNLHNKRRPATLGLSDFA